MVKLGMVYCFTNITHFGSPTSTHPPTPMVIPSVTFQGTTSATAKASEAKSCCPALRSRCSKAEAGAEPGERGKSPRNMKKNMEKTWEYHGNIIGISWGNYRKIVGISWEYHRNIMGKLFENRGINIGKYEKTYEYHGKLIGKNHWKYMEDHGKIMENHNMGKDEGKYAINGGV